MSWPAVISITWYPGKLNSLILHGESSNRLDKNDALVSGCVEMINNPLHNKPTQRSYCDCQCSLLAADLEGIKFEIIIMQKDIKTNASKSRADEVNRLKIELSSEREKCERLCPL